MKDKSTLIPLLLSVAFTSFSQQRSQEKEPVGIQEITVGAFLSFDRLYADMPVDWNRESRFTPLLEDVERYYRLTGIHPLILDLFADIRFTPEFSIQGRFGFALGEPHFFPESDVMAKYRLVEVSGIQAYAVGGVFFQQWSGFSHYAWGIEGGLRFGPLPVELIIQRPFQPLEYGWPSKYGGYVQTQIHTWLWRVGLAIPIWSIDN